MKRAVTNAQMRSADEYTISKVGVPSETLMRRAGEGIAEEVVKVFKKDSRITVVCGVGNNGGDGYVCAQYLFERGFPVSVLAIEGNLSEDCKREKARYKGGYTQTLGDIVVDCIFGTGLTRRASGIYAEIIERINSSGAYVVSADIPSGLNGDNGASYGLAVKADLTVAIGEIKLGELLSDGLDLCGKIVVKDIGIKFPEEKFVSIFEDGDIKKFFPKRPRNSHKGSFGTANLIAGKLFKGAAALSLEGALKSGCGLVKFTGDRAFTDNLVLKYPQAVYSDKVDLSANAIALGMGCGVSESLKEEIEFLLKNYTGTLIIDADGLNTISALNVDLKNKSCTLVLTPHIKEFSRLSHLSVEEILSDPLKHAEKFAYDNGVVLLLKSASTIISDGARTALNVRGTSALAKGGSGDMLAGFLCGSAARGLEAFYAGVCASYALGVSAEISSEQKTDYCVTAKDVIKNLHFAVKRLTED